MCTYVCQFLASLALRQIETRWNQLLFMFCLPCFPFWAAFFLIFVAENYVPFSLISRPTRKKNMQHIGPSKALRPWGETECRNQNEQKNNAPSNIFYSFNMLLMFDEIVGNAARLKRTCSFDLETKNVSDTEKWAQCKYVPLYFFKPGLKSKFLIFSIHDFFWHGNSCFCIAQIKRNVELSFL